jgi:Exostosin family
MIHFFHHKELSTTIQFIVQSTCYKRVLNMEQAQFIIYENALQNIGEKGNDVLKEISATSPKNIKTLVFIIDDFEKKYTYYPNLILLRTSIQYSIKRENEILLPYLWDHQDINFNLSLASALPQIGFCGVVSKHRKKMISVFESSNKVKCNFIKQKEFWGGNPHHKDVVEMFYNNLEQNQYILCNRGRGNFSIRFYQTLAAGRVPVVVDTDVDLPFKNSIDWDEIIILQKTEKECLQAVIKDHQQNGYILRQAKARFIFREYFSKEKYFDKLMGSELGNKFKGILNS